VTSLSTRHLSSARLQVVSDARSRTALRWLLATVLVTLALLQGMRLATEAKAAVDERTRLQRENTVLRERVSALESELQLEHATGAALSQQVGELGQQVNDLERALAFVDSQRSRGRGGAGPAQLATN
jgi:regulator of replication initiation timing